MKEITLTAHDGLVLHATLFECKNPKALVQVIHGAKEHKERYYDICEFFNANGYAVIVSDNRGHGASVNKPYPLGHFETAEQMLNDQLLITAHIKGLYPDKPLYLFGHSLGSCIARYYLQEHDDEIEKLLLTGTVFPVPLCTVGNKVCGLSQKLYGKAAAKGLVAKLANNDNDKWVCQNPSVMVVYRKDPLVKGCVYTTAAVNAIVELTGTLSDRPAFRCRNPELKILSCTGKEDICTGGEHGLQASLTLLGKVGYINVRHKVYEHMKHEVINEKGNQKVYADMLAFFEE